MNQLTMVALVRRAQTGNRDAFGKLAVHFQPTVFAIVLRRLRNRSEACEVTQDVFVQAFRKMSQLREPEAFPGWLRQIASRMSINRAVRRPHEVVFQPDSFNTLKIEPQTPLDVLLRNEASQHVWNGLRRLRPMDRETLIAFYVDGHSLKQMSDQFERPIGTIKRRLHTARNRLREQLVATEPA